MEEQRILELLRRNRQGLTLQHIFKELRVTRKERAKLEGRLIDLENKKLIRRVKNRYLLPVQSDLLRGRFETSGRGFGFVVPEDRSTADVFVPGRFAKGAMQGDTVEILFAERGLKGKSEGRVVRILKKEKKSIIGLYEERSGAPVLVPFDAPSLEEIRLVSRGGFFPAPGEVIAADRGRLTITEVFGMPDAPGVDTKVVIRKYGLAEEFSGPALAEADEAAGRPVLAAGRVDHRGWTTFTIDGETAQDFDDAVSVRKLEGGRYLLGVHIADVSHYVEAGSALDRDACARGTSVYFPDLTLPMLPEKLSNDICSLRPREDRLTVSAVMEIDADGSVVHADFHPSIIRTAERLTYTSVFKIFENEADERRKQAALVPDLLIMRDLARLLRGKRVGEGSLDFDLLEPELVYKEGRLASIATFAQNEAHKLIEEFMVAANVAVASFLNRKDVASIYRVHPPPSTADLEKLREILFHFGIALPKPDKIRSADLQRAIREAEGKPGEKYVNVQVLRAMKLAVYSEENLGHYGLAKKEYTHFTSPIRRYPDLAVHRLLKRVLAGLPPAAEPLAAVALHASGQERKAAGAEQDLVEWRIFRFLKEKLGEEFTGIVVDITRAGLAVELNDYFVKGVVSYEDLGGDYFQERTRGVLSGRRSGKTFEVGQSLHVILAAVDPVLRRMSLVPADQQSPPLLKGGRGD
ncbi:MAG: ribonuclease R [Candidatus Aminicenantes bacterium]|nr:ribonuclease R [Candidatus Aminicenantes bacterium]